MSILDLWLPILAVTVATFMAGAVIWMFMPWHKTDWSRVSDEEAAGKALRDLAPGQYNIPYCADQAEMMSPEQQQKFKDGPVTFITILPKGMPSMAPNLILMAMYNLLVAILCAYFVTRTAPAGADYMTVFRITSAIAFIAYGMAYVQESIWFGRPWSSTMKTFLDAAIYAGLTGGLFGWLM